MQHIFNNNGNTLCGMTGGEARQFSVCPECMSLDKVLNLNPHNTGPSETTYIPQQSDAKVVISITSVPARNGTLDPTLESLRNQTRPPDEIRLYLGPGCERVQWTKDDRPPLVCVPTIDHGPVTKLSAAVDPCVRADAVIITVDDDIVFAARWLETLLGYVDKHPDDAVGMAGWNADVLLSTGRYERASGPCDVIEGFGGVAYHKWFFGPDILLPPPQLKFVDDVWISSYLHRLGIVRRVVPGQEKFVDTTRSSIQEGIHTKNDFDLSNKQGVKLYLPHYEERGIARRRRIEAEGR